MFWSTCESSCLKGVGLDQAVVFVAGYAIVDVGHGWLDVQRSALDEITSESGFHVTWPDVITNRRQQHRWTSITVLCWLEESGQTRLSTIIEHS